jgi:hypothetical protein
MTGEGFVFLVEARLTAIRSLRGLKVELSALAGVRTEYLTTRQDYGQLLPKLVEAAPERAAKLLPSSESGEILLPPTFDEMAKRACLDTLTILGIYLLGIEHGRQEAS